MNGSIGKLSGAVSAHSAAAKTMQAENDVFIVEIPAGIGSEAATVFRGVIGAESAGTGNLGVDGARPSRYR